MRAILGCSHRLMTPQKACVWPVWAGLLEAFPRTMGKGGRGGRVRAVVSQTQNSQNIGQVRGLRCSERVDELALKTPSCIITEEIASIPSAKKRCHPPAVNKEEGPY